MQCSAVNECYGNTGGFTAALKSPSALRRTFDAVGVACPGLGGAGDG